MPSPSPSSSNDDETAGQCSLGDLIGDELGGQGDRSTGTTATGCRRAEGGQYGAAGAGGGRSGAAPGGEEGGDERFGQAVQLVARPGRAEEDYGFVVRARLELARGQVQREVVIGGFSVGSSE